MKSAAHQPARFDAFKLAAHGGTLSGEIDAATLPRIADRLLASAAPARIGWRITGGPDAQGRPTLTLDLDGAVSLICQRCLGPLAWPVMQQTIVLVARDEAELARLDADEPEVVLAGLLDPRVLVEDELVLSLPFVPRHADAACTAGALPAAEDRDSMSPFVRLADMKRK